MSLKKDWLNSEIQLYICESINWASIRFQLHSISLSCLVFVGLSRKRTTDRTHSVWVTNYNHTAKSNVRQVFSSSLNPLEVPNLSQILQRFSPEQQIRQGHSQLCERRGPLGGQGKAVALRQEARKARMSGQEAVNLRWRKAASITTWEKPRPLSPKSPACFRPELGRIPVQVLNCLFVGLSNESRKVLPWQLQSSKPHFLRKFKKPDGSPWSSGCCMPSTQTNVALLLQRQTSWSGDQHTVRV